MRDKGKHVTSSTTNLQLDLEGFAFGGDAFGRADDGRMIFVPYAAPGERIHCRLVEEHTRYAKAELIDVLTPHPERIEARCPHFGACGGCHYQFLPYEVQIQSKEDILRSQLERIGKMQAPPLREMIPSPSPWHMRNQIQFHQTEEGALGFHRPRSRDVLPITTCLLPLEPIAELWPRMDVERLPEVDRIAFRCDSDEHVMVVFYSRKPAHVDMRMDVPASVAWVTPQRTQILGGESHLHYDVHDHTFAVSPASFFQVNSALIETMVDTTFAFLEIQKGETIFDLYAGVGLFSAFAAKKGASVIAFERSPSACNDYTVNLDLFDSIELYQGPVEDLLPALGRKPHAVIMDPPRAGLTREVRDALIESRPERMVYISCDTATFARDARRLIDGGFTCTAIQPIDLFPQTSHIELISSWS